MLAKISIVLAQLGLKLNPGARSQTKLPSQHHWDMTRTLRLHERQRNIKPSEFFYFSLSFSLSPAMTARGKLAPSHVPASAEVISATVQMFPVEKSFKKISFIITTKV